MSEQQSAFRLDIQDGIAIVTIDVPGEAQNTLKLEFAEQIESVIGSIEQSDDVIGVIVTSGKENGFVAGADIRMLQAAKTAADAEHISKMAQAAFKRLEALPVPVVAAIHGPCLGGGYELALACHGRVATDDRSTKIGLPEVQLGVLPAGGGTQRLPRLVGIERALTLMLTGQQLDARRAKKYGLIDEVVPRANLMKAARALIDSLRAGKLTRKTPTLSFGGIKRLLLEDNPLGRQVLFDQVRKQTRRKTKGHYPAPDAIIEAVETGIEKGMEAGFAAEARLFGELVVSSVARHLMTLFFATTALKKDTGVDKKTTTRPIEKVGVLGGGLMGAGIAFVTAAKAGLPVRIKDRDETGVNHALNYSWQRLSKWRKQKRLSPLEFSRTMARLTGCTDYSGFAEADLVIEAVFEDLDLKRQMLADIEQLSRKEVIFASNTSSIPIGEIAAEAKHPERVIGLHYFSPVEKMPLLEIVRTDKTADWVVATCVEFGKKQGKHVIVVNDGPGFYTSRILAPYVAEAGYLVGEGCPVEAIDKALETFGFPVGPLRLLDEVGIDVGTKIAPVLHQAFGDRMAPPPAFAKLIESGRKGRKNGQGFYKYDQNYRGNRPVDETIYQTLGVTPKQVDNLNEIAERCVLLMVNEAVRCLDEGILRSARDGDIGAVFGLGFPPFLGGPFRYVDNVGAQTIVDKLRHYESKFGERFTPAPGLLRLAEQQGTFFND